MPLSPDEKRLNQLNRTYDRFLSLTIGKCKNEALKDFQKLRRLQEREPNGVCQCISCGKFEYWHKMDAGHFISRQHTYTAFKDMNVWPQCKKCNQPPERGGLSGNLAEYRKRLVLKIGIESVEYLEETKSVKIEITKWQYAVMREMYRSRVKLIEGK